MAASTPAGPEAIPCRRAALSRFWSRAVRARKEVLCPSSAKPFSYTAFRAMPSARAFRRAVSSGVSSAKRPLTRSPGLQAGRLAHSTRKEAASRSTVSTRRTARTLPGE